MSTIKGADQLANRLGAMSRSPRGYSREWGDEYVQVARPLIPIKTGKTRHSVQRAQTTAKGAEIMGSEVAVMIDTGTRRHSITPRRKDTLAFPVRGRTVFARKVNHPGQRAKPYRMRAALEALRRVPLAERVINAWNRAA